MPFVVDTTRAGLGNASGRALADVPHMFVGEVNLATNPRFEAGALAVDPGIARFGTPIGSLGPLSGVFASSALEGGYSLRLAAGDSIALYLGAVVPGQVLAAGIDAGLAANAAATLILRFLDGTGTPLGPDTTASWSSAGTQTITVTGAAPLGAGYAAVLAQSIGGVSAFDRLIVGPKTVPFFDGDSGACVWNGPRWWSSSSRLGSAVDLDYMCRISAPYWSSDSALLTSLPVS